jgi:hypothetical protein
MTLRQNNLVVVGSHGIWISENGWLVLASGSLLDCLFEHVTINPGDLWRYA